jgi:hypothetical protein
MIPINTNPDQGSCSNIVYAVNVNEEKEVMDPHKPVARPNFTFGKREISLTVLIHPMKKQPINCG